MKKYCYFVGLLVIHPLISARYNSSKTSGKNSNHSSPPLKQTKHTQTPKPEFQTAPDKKYKRNISALLGLFCLRPLTSSYTTEKKRRFTGWKLDDLALLKSLRKYPQLLDITGQLKRISNQRTWNMIIKLG